MNCNITKIKQNVTNNYSLEKYNCIEIRITRDSNKLFLGTRKFLLRKAYN